MMALRSRDATGQGQQIDIGLYEPIFRILDEMAPAYDKVGIHPPAHGRGGRPTSVRTAITRPATGGGSPLPAPTTRSSPAWPRLMGRPEVAGDGIYGTIAQREKQRAAVDGLVADWAKQHTQQEAVRLCDGAEVPCGIVASVDEIFLDPHYAARGNIARVSDPRAGELAVPNVVPRLTGTPGGIDTLGPSLGQHNAEVYGSLLGMSAADLASLEAEGVI